MKDFVGIVAFGIVMMMVLFAANHVGASKVQDYIDANAVEVRD